MNYQEFCENLIKNRLLQPIWKLTIDMASRQFENENKEEYLKIFAMYFGLVDDGNICIPLDESKLKNKWLNKVTSTRISLEESGEVSLPIFDEIIKESEKVINGYIQDITESNFPEIIGKNRLFEIEDGFLYSHKYNVARKGVIDRVNVLFGKHVSSSEHFDANAINSFKLADKQSKAVDEGLNNSLIITGGPGCGKTTSILFLLLNIFKNDSEDYTVYLVAPSGKASSRMKDSIIKEFRGIEADYKNKNESAINKIKNLDSMTIHSMLELDRNTNTFRHNTKHKFPEKSIFVIDEASMIDICLFYSLLQAIPDNAKVYIMGDQDQLPSVESGAVLGDIIKRTNIQENWIKLDVSIRFTSDTEVYKLANVINNNESLDYIKDKWQDCSEFKIYPFEKGKTPIYYYDLVKENKPKEAVLRITKIWADKFYKELQEKASNLDSTNLPYLEKLFNLTEEAKILSAENEGPKGVKKMNSLVKDLVINKKEPISVNGHYPGELMMINTNNRRYDLYNGDSGILVTFKDDPTLYFMVKKSTKLVEKEEKLVDKIFKLGDYVFYPFRMITSDEIDLAYAITIHKSQGSDYNNILVILPTKKGHPLLNRQIVYTAITRTKGNTYIVSSQERLEEAKENLIERITNIA